MFEALNVALNARESISEQLKSVSRSASEVSQEFAETAGASVNMGQSMSISHQEVGEMEDALKSIPDDAQVSAQALGHVQNVAEQLGDESQELTANFEMLDAALSDLPNNLLQSNAAFRSLDSAMDDVEGTTYSMAAGTHILSEAYDDATHGAARFAAMNAMLERELEDVRNDALAGASAVNTFNAAAAASSITDLGVNVGPFTGSVSQLAGALAVLLPLIGALGTSLAGAATAATALAAGIGGLFTAGLVSRAEKMAQYSSDIEGTAEGLQEIFSQVASAIDEATAPLQTLPTEEFAISGLEGFVQWVGIASQHLAEMSDVLMPIATAIGGAFLAQSPEFFTELGRMVEVLGPLIQDLMTGLIQDMPALIAYMRAETKQLLPILGRFMDAFIALAAPVFEIGTAVLSVLLPPLSMLLDFLAGAADAVAFILTPVLNTLGTVLNWVSATFKPLIRFTGFAISAFLTFGAILWTINNVGLVLASTYGILTSVYGVLAGVIGSSVVGALYSMAAAAWASLGPFGVLAGLVLALLGYFGLLDDIVSGIVDKGVDLLNMIPGIDINNNTGGGSSDPPASPGPNQVVQDNSRNTEIGSITVEGEGTTESRIRNIVREEVKMANEQDRRRQNGRTG